MMGKKKAKAKAIQLYSTRRQGYLVAGHRITATPVRFLVIDAPTDEGAADRAKRHDSRKLTQQEVDRLEDMKARTPEGKHPPVHILEQDIGPEIQELDDVRVEIDRAHAKLKEIESALAGKRDELTAANTAHETAMVDLAKATDKQRAVDAAVAAQEAKLA